MNPRRCCFVLLCLLLTGCAAKLPAGEPLDPGEDPSARFAAPAAPKTPIAAPRLPPRLEAAAKAAPAQAIPADQPLPYTVECATPTVPELANSFSKNSILNRLIDTPPNGRAALEQRLAVSLNEGRDILHSYGYYAGNVTGGIELPPALSGNGESLAPPPEEKAPHEAAKAVVRVTFEPGPRYTLGRTRVTIVTENGREEPVPEREPPLRLPHSLADVELAEGSPAEAGAVTSAVDRVRDAFQEKGHPFAELASARYTLDHGARRLEADVRIKPGAFVRMGEVRAEGDVSVTQYWLDIQRPWKPGAPWNQKDIEAYRDKLRQSGLFRSIEIAPAAAEDGEGRREVLVTLASAPERTLSGALKYDSDFGLGVQGNWEHRNLTGRGDRLSLSLPLWMDMQEFTAKYRLPFFFREDQTFTAQAGLLNQNLDAYELRSAAGAAGMERRFSPHWAGAFQLGAEGGEVKDPGRPRRGYALLSLPVSLTFDNTGSLLDAVKGVRVTAAVGPYAGTYNESFTTLRGRLDAYAFAPLVGEDTLVLALRGTYGALVGANARDVPPTVRFYSGGGGSVRGYAYQSLGPRSSGKDPLGGTSLIEFSGEARLKFLKEFGIVAFLDGGTAFEGGPADFADEVRLGAGVGLRYYTAIGPLRLDVATPLTPRSDDAPLQFYISIGQSF